MGELPAEVMIKRKVRIIFDNILCLVNSKILIFFWKIKKHHWKFLKENIYIKELQTIKISVWPWSRKVSQKVTPISLFFLLITTKLMGEYDIKISIFQNCWTTE